MSDWLEQYVEDYNNRVYKGLMSPSANRLLREMKRKEHEEWERRSGRCGLRIRRVRKAGAR